jgi:protease PrsW
LTLAIALHATWGGSTNLAVHIVVAVISLLILLVLIHRSHTGRAPNTVNPTRTRA